MFTDTHLQAFDSVVRDLKVQAYLCGGTVRDLLINRPIRDVDVVLSGRITESASQFAKRLNVPFFVMDPEREVVRVVCKPGNWDFTGFRNDTIEGDLQKRDFSINAMAVRWEDFFPNRSLTPLLDPFGGRNDLQQKLIRAVSEQSLKEDPLRMLRAFRMQAELGFAMDPAVTSAIDHLHPLISNVAVERVTEELDRIFLIPNSASSWKNLGSTLLFDSLFPEMKAMKGCDQGGYHHLDVWDHSVEALENLESFLADLSKHFPRHASHLLNYLDSVAGTLDRCRLLKWALILHDIGKPQTRELREPGRWRFHGHDHAGVDLAELLLKRLKFARKDSLVICSLIEHHLRPLNLFKLETRDTDTSYRFFRAAGTEAPGVLLISYGDMTAARGPLADPERAPAFIRMMQELISYYFDEYYPAVNTPAILKGRDLMAVLQMKEGPLMGQLLQEVREAQLQRRLLTREDALDFARNWLKNKEQ